MRTTTWALATWMAVTAACGGDPTATDTGQDATGEDGSTPDGDGGAEADVVGETDADIDTDACAPDRMCYADFPCRDESYCRDERTVVECESVHCSSPRVCGTTCCSGGTCLPTLAAPTTCRDGEWCYENPEGNPSGFGGPGRSARCLPGPSADGGTDGEIDYDAYIRPEVYEPYCR